MALNIRDPEVHRLARAVADATGETMTEAVKTALPTASRRRQVSEAERERRFAAIWSTLAVSSCPSSIRDRSTRSWPYDENGLPT